MGYSCQRPLRSARKNTKKRPSKDFESLSHFTTLILTGMSTMARSCFSPRSCSLAAPCLRPLIDRIPDFGFDFHRRVRTNPIMNNHLTSSYRKQETRPPVRKVVKSPRERDSATCRPEEIVRPRQSEGRGASRIRLSCRNRQSPAAEGAQSCPPPARTTMGDRRALLLHLLFLATEQ